MTDKQDEPMILFSEVERVIQNRLVAGCNCHQCLTLHGVLQELRPPSEPIVLPGTIS